MQFFVSARVHCSECGEPATTTLMFESGETDISYIPFGMSAPFTVHEWPEGWGYGTTEWGGQSEHPSCARCLGAAKAKQAAADAAKAEEAARRKAARDKKKITASDA